MTNNHRISRNILFAVFLALLACTETATGQTHQTDERRLGIVTVTPDVRPRNLTKKRRLFPKNLARTFKCNPTRNDINCEFEFKGDARSVQHHLSNALYVASGGRAKAKCWNSGSRRQTAVSCKYIGNSSLIDYDILKRELFYERDECSEECERVKQDVRQREIELAYERKLAAENEEHARELERERVRAASLEKALAILMKEKKQK